MVRVNVFILGKGGEQIEVSAEPREETKRRRVTVARVREVGMEKS